MRANFCRISASSKLALTWLAEGKVHIAGSHLEDAKTGEFNLPYLRKQFPGEEFSVVTFARWEEGLILASGNPSSFSARTSLATKDLLPTSLCARVSRFLRPLSARTSNSPSPST